jgi:hypothetical protein
MLQKLDERSDRFPAKGMGLLDYIIHDIFQLLILRLKELVQVVELGPNHVPQDGHVLDFQVLRQHDEKQPGSSSASGASA